MSKCKSCGAEIRWAKHHVSGKNMPLQPAPAAAEHGLFVIYQGGGVTRARPVQDDSLDRTDVYVSHFALCPDANRWRK